MAGGEIKEQGTRDELLAKNGLYAELCRLQALSPISENGGPA